MAVHGMQDGGGVLLLLPLLLMVLCAVAAVAPTSAAPSGIPACDTPPEELMGVNGTFGIGQQGGDGEYPPSLTCSWHLRGQEHQQLRAWFNWIDLEQFANCESADYVQVATDEGVILETACGNSLEGTTEATAPVGQGMVISFVSDFFQGGDGFEMGWSFTEDDSGSSSGSGSGSDTGVSTSSDAKACGADKPAVLGGMNGTFGVGQPGETYPDDTDCLWTLEAMEGYHTHISIVWLNLPDSAAAAGFACGASGVTLSWDGTSSTLCQSQVPNDEIIADVTVTVLFVSNVSDVEGTGFGIEYYRTPVAEPPAAGPGFVDGYPQYTVQDEHTVEAHVRVTEPCTVYFVLATDGGETPTAQQVRDNDPSIDRYLGGNLYRLDVATNELLVTLQELDTDVTYRVYFALEDLQDPPVLSQTVTTLTVVAPGVASAPTFSEGYPRTGDMTTTRIIVEFALDELGTVYWVLMPADSLMPSVEDVLQGHAANGVTPLRSGHAAVTLTQTTTLVEVDSLNPDTGYVMFAVTSDEAEPPHTSSEVTAIEASTLAGEPTDCQVEEWGPWGECSVPCGTGEQSRTRPVAVPASGGGTACPPTTETQPCDAGFCSALACEDDQPEILSSSNGTFGIGAPGGSPYNTFATCSWVVAAADDETARVWFDWIDVEETAGCTADSVTVYRGDSSDQLERVCGNDVSTTTEQSITGGSLKIVFTTDFSGSGWGFGMGYAVTKRDGPANCAVSEWGAWGECSASCNGGVRQRSRTVEVQPEDGGEPCPDLSDSEACNEVLCPIEACMTPPAELTARNGTIGIGSPEHPGYATYEHCAWVIKAGDNSRVRMWYTFLDLPEDDPCNVQVVVRSGATEDGDQLAATCGTELPEELSVSGLSEVRVDFLNNGEDKEKVFSGFALQYIVETADERVDCVPGPWSEWGQCSATCGGGQHARTRGVEVPAQNGGTECTDMSQTEDCNQQPCTSAACGADKPEVRSDNQGVLGVGVRGSSDPSGVADDAECEWVIDCAMGEQVHVWFSWVNLEDSDGCTSEAVVVSDGTSELERVCGAHNANPEEPSIQPVYGEKTIVGKPVHITLSRPTASGGNPGFELQYEVTEAAAKQDCIVSEWGDFGACSETCGGGTKVRERTVIQAATGGGTACPELTNTVDCNTGPCTTDACGADQPLVLDAASGNFGYGTPGGADYPHDSRCSWLIKADADAQVHFSVDWIDVEGDPAWGCVTDKVVIHEGSDSASGELESYCGHTCDCEVTAGPTGSSGILVTFTSSFFGSGSGFGISYTVADSAPVNCGVSQWTAWSVCSKPCGGGSQSRSREVLVPPQDGGLACPNDLTQSQTCNAEACNSDKTVAATVTIKYLYSLWDSNLADFVAHFQETVAAALNIATERIVVVSVGGVPVSGSFVGLAAGSKALEVSFEILPPHDASDNLAAPDAVDAFQAMLRDSNSPIMQSATTRFINTAQETNVQYAKPPGIRMTTQVLAITLAPGAEVTKTVTVENTGESSLVISSIAQAMPTVTWLKVTPSSMTLSGGAQGVITIVVSNTPNKEVVQVINLETNVPKGPHAIAVDVSSGTSGSGGLLSGDGFMPGLIVGSGGLLLFVILIAVCICWCRRKCSKKGPRRGGISSRDRFSAMKDAPDNGTDVEKAGMLGDDSVATRAVELKDVGVDDSPGRDDSFTSARASRGSSMSGAGMGAGGGAGSSAAATAGGARGSFSVGTGSKGGGAGARSAGGGGGGGGGAQTLSSPVPPSIKLAPEPSVLAPSVFEGKWGSASTLEIWGATLRGPLSERQLEDALAAVHIVCMASGTIDDVQKFYFYAEQASTQALYMAEVSVASPSLRLSAVIKGADTVVGASFAALFKQALASMVYSEV